MTKLKSALTLIDQYNKQDPNQEMWQGEHLPKELLYSQRMTDFLREFDPDATEALQIAARAQHIGRWKIPRSRYSNDLAGYHEWRNTLKKFHADEVAGILEDVGYSQSMIDRVRFLVQKKSLKRDPESQTLEDVVCLVFLQYYAADFAQDKSEGKMIEILKKTWRKMSDEGRIAVGKLSLDESVKSLIEKIH